MKWFVNYVYGGEKKEVKKYEKYINSINFYSNTNYINRNKLWII